MRILGIDYGSKRVGIAVSDEAGKLAFPLKILKNDVYLLDMVHNICGEQEAKEIVIGESTDFSGKPNEIMLEIEKFKNKLSELGLPIFLEKEFFTTLEARGRDGKERRNARKIKNIQKKEVDASAAALILQRYLDRKNNDINR